MFPGLSIDSNGPFSGWTGLRMRARKLTDVQVSEIRELAKTKIKKVDIARQYGVSPQLISTVVRHNYNNRPIRVRVWKREDGMETWESLARQYNATHDDKITPAQAKQIHDKALRKIRWYFEDQGLTREDLV